MRWGREGRDIERRGSYEGWRKRVKRRKWRRTKRRRKKVRKEKRA